MKGKPYLSKCKYDKCFDECDMFGMDELCPTDPDLLLLRKNAQGEREAIAYYLRAAEITGGKLCELFLDTARDEMIHFRNIMLLLAKYDSEQAIALDEADIDLPIEEFRKKDICPEDRLEIIDLLTKSITDELSAINMYQESYEAACHEDVMALFCQHANDEKLHVAEFWKILSCYTKEHTIRP